MSDIAINISWLDIALYAPLLGWPGLLIGAALGALVWRKRRILGVVLGGLAGALVWTFSAILLH